MNNPAASAMLDRFDLIKPRTSDALDHPLPLGEGRGEGSTPAPLDTVESRP